MLAVLQCVMHNISQQELEEGQVQYVMYGKDHEKNRCIFLARESVHSAMFSSLLREGECNT